MDIEKSWFVFNRRKPGFPEELAEEFINRFTKPGDVVLDPFLRNGSILVACYNTKRNGIGIEREKEIAASAKEHIGKMESQLQLGMTGAEQKSKQFVINDNPENIGYVWQQYSLPLIDFVLTMPKTKDVERAMDVFVKLKEKIREGGCLVVVLQDLGTISDFVQKMKEHYEFQGEKIWCQENRAKVTGNLHNYCLIFRKV